MPDIIFNTELKDIQVEGLEWLLNKREAGIDFSTGGGKTLLAYVAGAYLMEKVNFDYVFIFHIKSALAAFVEEARKHKNIKHCFPYTIGAIRKAPYFNMIQYNHINRLYKEIIFETTRCKSVGILDEIQHIKTPTSSTRKKFDLIRPRLTYTFGLTATPIGNRIDDLFHMTDYIKPGFFGNYFQYRARYCKLKSRNISVKNRKTGKRVRRTIMEVKGYQNLDHLHKRLNDIWLVRSETMEKEFKFYNLGELPPADERNYIQAARGIVEESKDLREFVNRLHPLQRVVDFTDIKVGRFIKALNKRAANKKGCLVYFAIKDSLHNLSKQFNHKHEILTGETSSDERMRIREEHNSATVIFCTTAGSRSFNFHAVDTVMFYNMPFEIEVFQQMIGRVARPFVSEYNAIKVIIPYVANTIDEYRIELMKANSELLKTLVPEGSPNLPEELKALRRSAIINLRKNLLWRIKHAKS